MSVAVSIRNVRHRYKDREALRGVSFDVASGEIVGLVGPNGSGKTTLFKILSTLLPLQAGEVSVGGSDLKQDPDGVRRQIGVTFQSPSLDIKLTVRENLTHQGHLYGLRGAVLQERISRALAQLHLTDRAEDFVETLSGGLKRRTEIAKCLLHEPQVLLLDEPSTGLDPGARLDFWNTLLSLKQTTGMTILVTTHLMEEARKCDRVVALEQGEVVPAKTRPATDIPRLVSSPTVVQAVGTKPKLIQEYVGRVNTGDEVISLARMVSPEGWLEPGQTPEFRELTLVLKGSLRVEFDGGDLWVREGQAVVCEPGVWIRYSTPEPGGAEYVAVCLPAFSPETVHRDA